MTKRIIYVSLFILILAFAVQSASASDADFNNVYLNDNSLDHSLDNSQVLSVDFQSLSEVDNRDIGSQDLSEANKNTDFKDADSGNEANKVSNDGNNNADIVDSDENGNNAVSQADDIISNTDAVSSVDVGNSDIISNIENSDIISNNENTDSDVADGGEIPTPSLNPVPVTGKLKTTISVTSKVYISETPYLKVYLKDESGVPLSGKTVYVKIGKKSYSLTTDESGVAKLKLSSKKATYKCTVSFKETDSYYGASKTLKVSVSKMPTYIKAPYLRIKSSQYGYFKVYLKDAYGRALKKRLVTVSIPALKRVFRLKTNSDGVATLKFNGPKSYRVIIKYAGNKKCFGKTVKSKILVSRVTVKFNDVLKAAEKFSKYVLANKTLPSKMECGGRTFTAPQLSYLMAAAIKKISQKKKTNIVLLATANPKSSGEIYDTVYKKNYLKIANAAVGSSINHKTPRFIRYSFYKVPYNVYTAAFSNILTYYKQTKKLSKYSLFTNAEFQKVPNSKKYTFYLTTDNIAGKKSDLKMLKQLAKTLRSKGYNAVIVGIGPDIHNLAYKFGCRGNKSVLFCCFGGVDVGCIEEWTGGIKKAGRLFKSHYAGAHVMALWYSKPYGSSVKLTKPVKRAWDANYGFALKNPAKYMAKYGISYLQAKTVQEACTLLKKNKIGGPNLFIVSDDDDDDHDDDHDDEEKDDD